MSNKNILITGSDGFIGSNLSIRLLEKGYYVETFTKKNKFKDLEQKIPNIDFIFHFAGVNRSKSNKNFSNVNVNLTKKICEMLVSQKKKIPIFFSSSTKVKDDSSPYSSSKLKAEKILKSHSKKKYPVIIARLPNVYGKWSKPNYNSFISTCCYNLSRNLKINLSDKNNKMEVIYIDDLIDQLINLIKFKKSKNFLNFKLKKIDKTSVGEIFNIISKIKNYRNELEILDLKKRLNANLYSTYVSFFSKKLASYKLLTNKNKTGIFTEFLKGKNFGQISTLSIKPGQTRGNHYHHSKVEKFLVIRGKAKFKFENILNKKNNFNILTNSKELRIIETIPGFTHNIKNIGNEELITIIWSNQIFDKIKPDTIFKKIN